MNDILNRLETYYHAFLKAIPQITLAIFIVGAGILLANWVAGVFHSKIKHKSHDPLMSDFLAKAVKLVLFVCVVLLALNAAGLNSIAAALLSTAGASAVIIGFAFKDIAENFLAGVILAFNRPFHVNDTVQIENVFGIVKSMEFRYTKITTFDGRNVYIPNSDVLTNPVYNFSEDGFFRTDFLVGIAYENDIEGAKKIIMTCIDDEPEIVKDDTHVNFVAEDELAASTVNLKVYFWVRTQDFRHATIQTRGRLMQSIKIRLEKNGFDLPSDISEFKFYESSKNFKVELVDSSKENKQ